MQFSVGFICVVPPNFMSLVLHFIADDIVDGCTNCGLSILHAQSSTKAISGQSTCHQITSEKTDSLFTLHVSLYVRRGLGKNEVD